MAWIYMCVCVYLMEYYSEIELEVYSGDEYYIVNKGNAIELCT